MSRLRRETPDAYARFRSRIWWKFAVVLFVLASNSSLANEGLWVENPEVVAFSVAKMTRDAEEIGLTRAVVAADLGDMLGQAGLKAKSAKHKGASGVLFLDVIVEDETFYASLGFWRMASYRLPDGQLKAEFVTVWQDYSVGVHHSDAKTVQATVGQIIEKFIGEYTEANNVGRPHTVASTP